MTNAILHSPTSLFGSLLDDPLIHYRHPDTGKRTAVTLPELFVAMTKDGVRDFPLLRPHQRHPWHAFLVQLAAIALHRADEAEPFTTGAQWRDALLALTPADPDGAAWCLVSPVSRPAFMQAPEPSGSIGSWKNVCVAADELDMLVTSKNHDLKASRMIESSPEDWVYALVSLQTQEGFLGAGNYGISRMNGGFASRCGVGVYPNGMWGKRWVRDLKALLNSRAQKVVADGSNKTGLHALLWLSPWDGTSSLPFDKLEPWYIEICRRVRLVKEDCIKARLIGSKAPRVAAKDLNGVTGDPWMPVDIPQAKALTIGARGFDYKLSVQLLLGDKYTKPIAQTWLASDDTDGVKLIAQGVARGQGKTEGYHERRIPISRRVRQALMTRQTDELAKLADERIEAISEVRKMLWGAIAVLLANGAKDDSGNHKDGSDTVTKRANVFTQPFEAECDAEFFTELAQEIESNDRISVRTRWLQKLATRAERFLRAAFIAGPRSGHLRYRAQAAALSRLHGAMRGNKLPALALALKSKQTEEETHELV